MELGSWSEAWAGGQTTSEESTFMYDFDSIAILVACHLDEKISIFNMVWSVHLYKAPIIKGFFHSCQGSQSIKICVPSHAE